MDVLESFAKLAGISVSDSRIEQLLNYVKNEIEFPSSDDMNCITPDVIKQCFPSTSNKGLENLNKFMNEARNQFKMKRTTEDNIAKVHSLGNSGLSPTHPLYKREDVTQMWECLSNKQANTIFVYGPPGVGKSTVAWAWALYTAKQNAVYWVHLGQSRYTYTYAILRGNEVYSSTATQLETIDFIVECGNGILIVDGLRESLRELILTACGKWQNNVQRQLIVISSESLHLGVEDEEDNFIEHVSYSWELEEFWAAFNDNEFFNGWLS